MGGWLHLSPARNAGSSLEVSSVPLKLSSLIFKKKVKSTYTFVFLKKNQFEVNTIQFEGLRYFSLSKINFFSQNPII